MNVTLDEAITIYAKAMRWWFGDRAETEAIERSQQLRGVGDEDGERVWLRVAASVNAIKARHPDRKSHAW